MDFLFSPAGRFRRWQYWTIHFLFWIIFATGWLYLQSAYDPTDPPLPETVAFEGFIVVLGLLLLLWCQICSTIKRYHDRGKSGWWWMVIYIPLIGWLWQLVECGFLAGDAKDNDYGPGLAPSGVEEEIRQLKARHGFGSSQSQDKQNPSPERRNAFPPPPRPLFGEGSKS